MILNSVGYLAWIICCGALYEDLYVKVDTKCSEEIRDCLVTQYVSILTYLSYANEHLKGSKTGTEHHVRFTIIITHVITGFQSVRAYF